MQRPLALLAAAVLAAGGALALAAPADAAVVASVHVRTTADHRISMPTSLPAGVVRFHVTGPAEEDLQLARPRSGATPQQLVDDDALLDSKGDPTAVERDFEASGGFSARTDGWLRLKPGTYYAFDANTGDDDSATLTADRIVVVQVHGRYDRGSLPHATATIAAVRDMDWARKPTSIHHRGVLQWVNASSEYHFIVLEQLQHGKTLADVKAAIAGTAKYEDVFTGTGWSTGVLSPYLKQASTYDLPRGTYALACFWPDEHGVPHAAMGMVRLIHLR